MLQIGRALPKSTAVRPTKTKNMHGRDGARLRRVHVGELAVLLELVEVAAKQSPYKEEFYDANGLPLATQTNGELLRCKAL